MSLMLLFLCFTNMVIIIIDGYQVSSKQLHEGLSKDLFNAGFLSEKTERLLR